MKLWRLGALLWPAIAATTAGAVYTTISDETLQHQLPLPQTSDFDIHDGPILAPILIPRVPGTENSQKVLRHFLDYFSNNLPEWTVTLQNSTSTTPIHGSEQIPFVNLIATRHPPWTSEGDVGYLTYVAHYDSLSQPEGFIGATDSAAPCAMILHAVTSIDAALTKKWNALQDQGYDPDLADDPESGIQVLLLDGEEAFKHWTDTDSLYGARSLAAEWDETLHPAMSTYRTKLNSIELFVLFDLLGCDEATPIPSWMQNTHWAYLKMAALESRLKSLNMFKGRASKNLFLSEGNKKNDAVFRSLVMQDDHIPFAARGVPILHLIPERFPAQWHRPGDNAEYLDINTVEDWSLLASAFAAEYLGLEGHFDLAPRPANRARDEL